MQTFLVQKASDFRNFMVCPQGQGEGEPVRTRGGEDQVFTICADVFYGWPLINVPLSLHHRIFRS